MAPFFSAKPAPCKHSSEAASLKTHKTLSLLIRIYQQLGINGPGSLTTARPGIFSSPEALFVLVACFEAARKPF
jgi:hypothetical protein